MARGNSAVNGRGQYGSNRQRRIAQQRQLQAIAEAGGAPAPDDIPTAILGGHTPLLMGIAEELAEHEHDSQLATAVGMRVQDMVAMLGPTDVGAIRHEAGILESQAENVQVDSAAYAGLLAGSVTGTLHSGGVVNTRTDRFVTAMSVHNEMAALKDEIIGPLSEVIALALRHGADRECGAILNALRLLEQLSPEAYAIMMDGQPPAERNRALRLD